MTIIKTNYKGKLMNKLKIVLLSSIIFAQGCSAFMSYSNTSDKQYSSKPSNCDFKIKVTDSGLGNYEEIGVINGCAGQKDISSYKSTIQPNVCKAGGDLVVARANGYGVFCQGIVFKKVR